MKTILTAWEVIKYSFVADHFPPNYVEKAISMEEQDFALSCLGWDAYEAMLADIADFGTVEEWNGSNTYAADDLAVFYGTVLKSLINGNTVIPSTDTAGVAWVEVDKFTTAKYQKLYEEHLRQYLAYKIAASSLDYSTYQSGGRGVIETFDENANTRTASKAIFIGIKQKAKADTDKMLYQMQEFIKRNETDYSDFRIFESCNESCRVRHSGRRIFFRT